jgi:hypothetical protein
MTSIRTGFIARRISTRVTVRKKQVQFNEMVLRMNAMEAEARDCRSVAHFLTERSHFHPTESDTATLECQ